MHLPTAIKQLCKITSKLKKNHKSKHFTLDGRLVGDLGEVLAEQNYRITLYEKLEKDYDAITSDNKKVQIKATFKDHINYPGNYVPEMFLALKINPDGTFEEIYNGPGKYIHKLIKRRKMPYNRLHRLPNKKLKEISGTIAGKERVKRI